MHSPLQFRDKRLAYKAELGRNCKLMILPSENQVHTALAFHLRAALKHALDLHVLTKPFNLLVVAYYSLYEMR